MKWIQLVTTIAPLIVGAVHAIERVVRGAKGKEKQDAAVDFLMTVLAGVETGLSRDLLNDAKVQEAIRSAIDAIVNIENVIAAVKVVKAPGA